MIGIHQSHADAVNDNRGVHRQWDDTLCWHAHVLGEQCGCDGTAVDYSTTEGTVQAYNQGHAAEALQCQLYKLSTLQAMSSAEDKACVGKSAFPLQMMQKPTCRVVRVEVRKEIVLAASILEVESINHKISSIDPFQVL